MFKPITLVTVTGADNSVRPKDLFAVADEYPFAEFAILLSRGNQSETEFTPRFPSEEWLDELAAEYHSLPRTKQKKLRFAGHVCGSWVRDILMGQWPWPYLNVNFASIVSRWQLNTHGINHKFDPVGLLQIIEEQAEKGRDIIFQYDGVNPGPLELCRQHGLKASALFDLSHGAGSLPEKWEAPLPGIACGYTGGLSHENVVAEIQKIMAVAGDTPFWIDAETHLRSADNRQFDLEKVRTFLEAAKPWVGVAKR